MEWPGLVVLTQKLTLQNMWLKGIKGFATVILCTKFIRTGLSLKQSFIPAVNDNLFLPSSRP